MFPLRQSPCKRSYYLFSAPARCNCKRSCFVMLAHANPVVKFGGTLATCGQRADNAITCLPRCSGGRASSTAAVASSSRHMQSARLACSSTGVAPSQLVYPAVVGFYVSTRCKSVSERMLSHSQLASTGVAPSRQVWVSASAFRCCNRDRCDRLGGDRAVPGAGMTRHSSR